MPKDYLELTKEDLLSAIRKLESRKKYGLIWDEEKTKEIFELESQNGLGCSSVSVGRVGAELCL